MNATIKSPVSVTPAFHMSSASTKCNPTVTCSSLDVFQSSCTITDGLTVRCGNTTIQAGETYDIVANVAGGAPESSHSWAASSSGAVIPAPSGQFRCNNSGAGTFTVQVLSALSTSGSDTVTVTVT